MYKDRKRYDKNGYIVVEYPEHPKAFDTGTGFFGVYEHILVAEEQLLDRHMKEGEVVHHFDGQKSNNSPDNLLVLSNPMHGKLHAWMNRNEIVPTNAYTERSKLGCIRCRHCEKPIHPDYIFCSDHCRVVGREKYIKPSKEELEVLVWSKPTVKVADDLGISDTTVGVLCKKLGVSKPPRGYWYKVSLENKKST